MKDEHLDKIMKQHNSDIYKDINVEQAVMHRIEEYEELRSEKIVYWEHVFSGLVLFSGILLVIFIQYISSNINSSIYGTWLQLYISIIRWILTFIFASITLTIVSLILFTSVFKIKKKLPQKYV